MSTSAKDYPSLVAAGEKVETIAVPAVLAVFNWPKGSDRYRRVERFIERLFTKWDQFQVAHRHPKWREVNLAATVPGWTRYTIAEQMLERVRGSPGGPSAQIKKRSAATSRPSSIASAPAHRRAGPIAKLYSVNFCNGASNRVGEDRDSPIRLTPHGANAVEVRKREISSPPQSPAPDRIIALQSEVRAS